MGEIGIGDGAEGGEGRGESVQQGAVEGEGVGDEVGELGGEDEGGVDGVEEETLPLRPTGPVGAGGEVVNEATESAAAKHLLSECLVGVR